jgi:hypothetical protein
MDLQIFRFRRGKMQAPQGNSSRFQRAAENNSLTGAAPRVSNTEGC